MTAPDEVFAALHAAARPIGARLFTVSVLDQAAALARRAWSSDPVAYPVSGVKPMRRDAWSAVVIEAGQTYVANRIAEVTELFPDHALIASLGCGAVVNIPVRQGEAVIGCVNLLDAEGHYTPARVAEAEALVARHAAEVAAACAAAARAMTAGPAG